MIAVALGLVAFSLACLSEQLWAVALTGPLVGSALTLWLIGPAIVIKPEE